MRDVHPTTQRPVIIKVPIYIRFERIMALVAKSEKYRKELMGSGLKTFTGELYDEIAMCGSERMPDYHIYKELDIHLQAKLSAQFMLSNMVEVVERHDKIQADRLKKFENKGKR